MGGEGIRQRGGGGIERGVKGSVKGGGNGGGGLTDVEPSRQLIANWVHGDKNSFTAYGKQKQQ